MPLAQAGHRLMRLAESTIRENWCLSLGSRMHKCLSLPHVIRSSRGGKPSPRAAAVATSPSRSRYLREAHHHSSGQPGSPIDLQNAIPMDECVRLEEALQAEESRKAEVEQSPRPRPVRRRSRWPFSLDDFAKTDEYRLPPLSTELAAFSPGPAEASPRRRGTNPSSSPHISQRNDNLQSRNDPSQSAARGSKGQVETAVEQLPSRTETRTRQERKASYAMRSTSKHRDKQREATARSPTFPRTTTSTDLGRLQDNKNPHRYSPPIAVQSETNTQENQDRERLTRVENAAAAGSRAPRVVSEPEPMQIVSESHVYFPLLSYCIILVLIHFVECTCLTILPTGGDRRYTPQSRSHWPRQKRFSSVRKYEDRIHSRV